MEGGEHEEEFDARVKASLKRIKIQKRQKFLLKEQEELNESEKRAVFFAKCFLAFMEILLLFVVGYEMYCTFSMPADQRSYISVACCTFVFVFCTIGLGTLYRAQDE